MSFLSGLTEDNWILLSALHRICRAELAWLKQMKTQPSKYILEEGRSLLTAFSGTCGYSSVILQTRQVVVSQGLVAMWYLKPYQ